MYLKTIEVQGFKSFANKIRFEFHNGITCIVGPNGSGKSNVADAVRWVFGEQSAKQLRSPNMQDVIFAGTQLRKPQSFAEVAITLDNADRNIALDFDEVTVSRKVFRSGESEYRLNGNSVRLKDIRELFFDTGIGKEGYSIIGQGQVDKILSGKAEERRELFDEACGIVKFKKRKTEALKKLDSEHQNMIRVNDILSELEHRVGPLKRQSENAKEYLRLRDELRSYDLNAFLLDEASLSQTIEKVARNLENANAELHEKKEEEDRLRKEYTDIDDEIRTIEWKIEHQRELVNESEGEKNAVLSDIRLSEEKMNSEERNRAHYAERIREIDAEISEKEEKNKADDEALLKIGEKLSEISAELSGKNRVIAEKETEIAVYQEKVDESHNAVIGILTEKSEVNAEFNRLDEIISRAETRSRELQASRADLNEKQAENVQETARIRETIEETQEKIDALHKELSEVQEALSEEANNYHDTRSQYNDLLIKHQIKRGRLDSLKNLVERYEGFNSAVKRVMELKSTRRGVYGTVSDLISVDKKYRTLIETALGGNFQNIIVETEQEAKSLVQLLKEERAGRATFLPLDAIKPSGGISDAKILSEPGVIGTADTLVSADRKYLPAVRYLLERFLAVDTIEHGLSLAKKYHYTLRIVTLEGEFLNVGGSITGGSFKNSNNVLGRTEELKSLEEEINQGRKEIENLEKRMNRHKQMRDSYQVEADDLGNEIHKAELVFTEMKAKYDALTRQNALFTSEYEEAGRKLQEAENEAGSARSRKDAIETAMKNLENANTENADSTDQLRAVLEEAQAALSALQAERESVRVLLSTETQRKEFLEESIQLRKDETYKGREEQVQLRARIAESEEATKALEDSILELKKKAEGFGMSDESLKEGLELLLKEKEALTASQRAYFEKRDALTNALNDLNKEIVRLEAQQEKAEEKLESLTEYLWTEYELTPSEAKEYRDELLDQETPAEIRRHAHELKQAIKNLGSVNVNAIDEYKEVSERYEFLKTQHDDLVKAEKTLQDVVNDLNSGMRRQFTEQFELIKQEFAATFRDIFRGGTGTLELNPEVDCIESDIAIISQPPGKKLSNMLQLSGGEKALTAIALIFAIQRLKPSPFCLLDEIEAALDDTNVVRFTNYVRQLTDKTQYIIITHRRGTMLSADRLYGITMQEKGVSALVSVNLVEKDLD